MAEAMLILRNVPIPRIRHDQRFKRGKAKVIVLAALRTGPKTSGEVGAAILTHRPDITPKQAANRAYQALLRLAESGAVLSSTLYIFGSGPGPEDALVRDERERFVEGHDDATHVIDILPFAPV